MTEGTSTLSYFIHCLGALWVFTAPLPVAAIYVSMTRGDTQAHRLATAKVTTIVGTLILAFFALTGQFFFNFFGVSPVAFQIAGGILLFVIGFNMVFSKEPEPALEELQHGKARKASDVAITPLATPLLSGPGAISGTIILKEQAQGFLQVASLYLAIALCMASTYLLFRVCNKSSDWLSPLILKVANRIFGLVLASMAAQFIITASKQLGILT